eukprot:603238-Hanusia_phi.AAC.1
MTAANVKPDIVTYSGDSGERTLPLLTFVFSSSTFSAVSSSSSPSQPSSQPARRYLSSLAIPPRHQAIRSGTTSRLGSSSSSAGSKG